MAYPGPETQARVREVLGFSVGEEQPQDARVDGHWERDGLVGEAVSWSVGYGPRTEAWLLKPAGAHAPLPAVVALHDHSGFKYFGKEKIADGPDTVPASITALRAQAYGGRAYANALAHAGFAVLVPDTFLWGSRRFPLEAMPARTRALGVAWHAASAPAHAVEDDIATYNAAAGQHEGVVERYCSVLGTTLAGVISYEDRVAANYLAARPGVDPARLACVGLSGGGCRAALLGATCDHMAATVVVGMMSTYAGLLDRHIASHTWMLFPSGWARHGDWPDLAACRAPSPLLVQYDLGDELFSEAGMRAADERLAAHYRFVGQPGRYRGEFYPGPHKFDLDMQAAAFAWLVDRLAVT